jgi:hypothetical protein
MKPRIKPLPKTGDANVYDVQIGGATWFRITISGCLQAVSRKHPLALLGVEVRRLTARPIWKQSENITLAAPYKQPNGPMREQFPR